MATRWKENDGIEDNNEGATQRGKKSKSKKDKRKKKLGARMVFPAGTRADLRSHERHMELAARAGPSSDEDMEFYGVKEGPLFVSKILPHLDIIGDITIDWMHNVLEG